MAVPIVRDVIKAYFDKKLGPKAPDNQMETQVRVLSQLRAPRSDRRQGRN